MTSRRQSLWSAFKYLYFARPVVHPRKPFLRKPRESLLKRIDTKAGTVEADLEEKLIGSHWAIQAAVLVLPLLGFMYFGLSFVRMLGALVGKSPGYEPWIDFWWKWLFT